MDWTQRETQARERMEDPRADPRRMDHSYAQFRHINRWVSSWHGLYRRYLKPTLQVGQPATLLDIGFGGGDLVRSLAGWAGRDGFDLHIHGVDTDARALRWVRGQSWPESVTFSDQRAEDLAASGRCFDWVISNHVLHHLDEAAWPSFLDASRQLGGRVLHCDLVRSRRAYGLFRCFLAPWFRPPFFPPSFIAEDGLLSIRRSYTLSEMQQRITDGWTVQSVFPFHQLVGHHLERR